MPKKKDHGYTKQHIVPRAYLNGFATPGKGKDKYMIGVRQKDQDPGSEIPHPQGIPGNRHQSGCGSNLEVFAF